MTTNAKEYAIIHGTFKFEGVEYAIVQDAFAYDAESYRGTAVKLTELQDYLDDRDAETQEYTVVWEITNFETENEDETCDWENPIEVWEI